MKHLEYMNILNYMYWTSTTILTQVPTIHKHASEHEAPPRDNFTCQHGQEWSSSIVHYVIDAQIQSTAILILLSSSRLKFPSSYNITITIVFSWQN
jgi:hypothetical protein